MNGYLYAPVEMRATPALGEWRTVAVLVCAPALRHVELAKVSLPRVIHRDPGGFDVAHEVLDSLVEDVQSIVHGLHTTTYSDVMQWWRVRSAHREDFVRVGAPLTGVAVDLRGVAAGILAERTGIRPAAPRRRGVARIISDALRAPELGPLFTHRQVDAGGSVIDFSRCWGRSERDLVAIEPFDVGRLDLDHALSRASRKFAEFTLMTEHGWQLQSFMVVRAPSHPGRGWRNVTSLLERSGRVLVAPDAGELRRAVEAAVRAAA